MAIDQSSIPTPLPAIEGADRDSMLVASLILDTANRLRRALSPSLDEDLGRLASAFWILLQLRLSPGGMIRMSDLAMQTGLTKSGLTRAVDRLEELGLVRREACPTDRRGAYAVLTELGRHQTTIAMTRHRREIEEALHETFSPEDESILVDLIRRLRDRVHSGTLMVLDAESPDVSLVPDPWVESAPSEDDELAVSHGGDGGDGGDGGLSGRAPHKTQAHRSTSTCGICESMTEGHTSPRILYENEHWVVRHVAAPYGVAGWMTMYSRRHVAGIAHFDAEESVSFGPTLARLQHHLEQVTGALRIYTLSLGESHPPHFHIHMVPRYRVTPGGVSGWDLFELLPQAGAGRVVVDPRRVEQICDAFREAVANDEALSSRAGATTQPIE